MDFNKDDELDYEEDDVENDFLKNDCESKNVAEDKTSKNLNISGFDDYYIQINCSEEEENFLNLIALDHESTEIQNDKKTDEESDKVHLEKPTSGKEKYTQTNNSNGNSTNNDNDNRSSNNNNNNYNSIYCNSNDNNNIICETKNKKFKKKKRPFHHRLGMKKPPSKTCTISSWLPKWNFSSANNILKPSRVPVNNKQILNLSRNFYTNSSSQFHLLELNAAQLKRINDRRLRHENDKSNIIMRNKNSNNSLSAQNVNVRVRRLADNYQIFEAKKNFKDCTPPDRIDNNYDAHNKNFGGKNKNSLFNGLYNSLKDDEKELVRLKKEARLKRFMNDDNVRKKRKLINSRENEIKDDLNLGPEYFQKLEEQKLIREKLLSLKGHQRKSTNFDRNVSASKPDINKELLLKKRNPFDANLGKSNYFLTNTIKQEKEIKQESFEKELFSPQGLSDIRSETGHPVMFVRTISKSFDEFVLRKPKTKVLESEEDESSWPNTVKALPFIADSKISYPRTDLSLQAESQLTGCIVKVFNIPPSTTTNDILALCSPIGVVKEIKLNLPKENSVVIRFREPACADNFFSIYHGQRMNNYFLNVIVV